jgi:hypothetical protein
MTYKLVIDQGATFRQTFIYKAGTTASNATPVNLTGWTARSMMRPSYSSNTVWATWNTENGGITLQAEGALGRIDMFSTAILTQNIPAGSGVWDLELVSPSGEVLRILEGPSEVTPEVTR